MGCGSRGLGGEGASCVWRVCGSECWQEESTHIFPSRVPLYLWKGHHMYVLPIL